MNMRSADRQPVRPAPFLSREPITTRLSSNRAVSLQFYLQELWRRRGLVRVLSGRQLKTQYEMNIIGFMWWLLDPLSFTLIFVIVMDFIFKQREPSYPLFLVIGLLPWKWFSGALTGSMNTVRANAALVTDLYFPRALLPIVEVSTELAHFCVGLLVVPIFMAAYHVGPSWSLLWLPAVIAATYVLALGLSYPLSVWGIYYRNLTSLTGNLLRLWMYLTPIIWSVDRMKHRPRFALLVRLNPLTGVAVAYRDVILNHRSPEWSLAYSAGFGVLAVVLGFWYFVRKETQFGKLV